MRRTLVLLMPLLLLPLVAAADECRYSAPRNLHDDLSGVRGVQIELHSHDMHLMGSGNSRSLEVTGRACASSESKLSNLQVTSHREGDQLIIDVGGNNNIDVSFFGVSYENLDLQIQLPSSMPVTVNTGSGDAYVSGLSQVNAQTGSGDLHINDISGAVTVTAGSGDVEVANIGSLRAGSVGSGDLKATTVRSDVHIGSVGSGDVELDQVSGSVDVGTLGSGDLTVRNVRGNLTVGAKGSGDVTHSNIGGSVNVPHDDDD
ncbi:DUF4097 family beta strand repeat-containing protein [Dyella mobilis]|uniref:DUF4097 family beta strand repeat protein n=1 Tax=Dyella mobilis TaxID=1849582 RepID=A0ABS2KLU3_9GAMM|nr:DUF4097 family beta strand repeat-containing protein [Dyella mobilis]MBM7132138.1 DUF4097 family beta strand repeat protein [Dyella mobilis]GLQ95877.1 hypothetical protein GCM10007863_02950 [Dyella mobilis]